MKMPELSSQIKKHGKEKGADRIRKQSGPWMWDRVRKKGLSNAQMMWPE